jgi:transposase
MKIRTIGIDLAKEVFGLHAVDVYGKVLLHTRVPRKRLLSGLTRLEPCLVGMEACGSAHYWAREIERLGHQVRLISPQFVTPYRKGNKNDPNDAEAICTTSSPSSIRAKRRIDSLSFIASSACGSDRLNHCCKK